MNSICIELTLVSPPETQFTRDGSKQFGVVVGVLQWEYKDQDFAQIIQVTAWRDVDLFLNLQEGDRVIFDGSINLRSIDKGSYKAKVAEITCNTFQVIGGSSGSSPSTPKPSVGVDFNKRLSTPVAAIAPTTTSTATDEAPDYSDIPF